MKQPNTRVKTGVDHCNGNERTKNKFVGLHRSGC